MPITHRPYAPGDLEFLFKLYASTRLHEISGWGWSHEQQEMFLRMQFNARQRWYEEAYERADHQLILLDGELIGRILVLHQQAANTLVDIALLAEHRNLGIGTRFVGELISLSNQQGVPVRLQVAKANPAAFRLYQRLGFVETGTDDMYFQMERACQ